MPRKRNTHTHTDCSRTGSRYCLRDTGSMFLHVKQSLFCVGGFACVADADNQRSVR